jgi:hypothetical protein
MSRSLYDQDTQIHKSGTYDDTIAPSLANWETTPASAEDDFNALRSAVALHIDGRASDWYTDLNAPTTLDNGTKRGINDLNTDLHANERKRILRRREVVGADVAVPAFVYAASNLLFNSAPINNETVTIDVKTYTFKAVLTPAEGEVLIEVTAAGCRDNLVNAIILGPGGGTKYQAAAAHPTVTAAAGAGDSLDATAKKAGTAGNSIATTETLTDVLSVWTGGTLAGGAGDVVILGVGGAGELPGELTAAVGAVTTLGTVVASVAGSFGVASLTEVAGGDSLSPKSEVKIADSATGEVIVDGDGNEIHGLIQSEFAGDGTTITVNTPNRVQISFIVHNATNDDLILADGAYIGGKTIDYSPVQRWAFEDIPEHAWLSDTDFIDAGSGAVDRQDVYNNQGILPVDLGTNAFLDLEGAGLSWNIRDDLEAVLFRIFEGSAGGTSEVQLGAAVDVFNNDAITNDFANELKVDTGGTEIDIGVTAGTIETTGAADLKVKGAGELYLDDGNQAGSTWAQTDGVKLSDTTAEWDAFETAFGEVSLLNAIVQAVGAVTRCKSVATVGGAAAADIPANTLIEGPGGPGVDNISADLCDYDTLTFVNDVDIFINGQLQWNGANAAANNDVYPSAVQAERQVGAFYAEFALKYRGGADPDVITMIAWG